MQARNSIIPLYFDHQEIRILDEDGHPWFIAADVCKALGIQNPTQATAKLEADERSMISIGRQGDTIVLSEAGVYTIALRCRDAMKPGTAPYRFRKWVTGTALPALRRGHDPATLNADMRGVIGGIVKGIIHKELTQIIPSLVAQELSSDRLKVIEGVSALQVAEMAGYVKGRRPRGMTQFVTARLRRYHEDRKHLPERSQHGSGRVLVYNESLARRWLMDGGRAEIDHYAAERNGQGKLQLVQS
ncbi:Bro-N domain-containing protein [Sphingobium yanoikuyae]|uniref:BRO-N domain-containing protein n=1 Tax=Sphingobium yanoikuyae TaxID=13690 RepID=UPI003B904CCB